MEVRVATYHVGGTVVSADQTGRAQDVEVGKGKGKLHIIIQRTAV